MNAAGMQSGIIGLNVDNSVCRGINNTDTEANVIQWNHETTPPPGYLPGAYPSREHLKNGTHPNWLTMQRMALTRISDAIRLGRARGGYLRGNISRGYLQEVISAYLIQ